MRTRYLVIVGVLALSLALAGCMGSGGGDANTSADADGNGSMDGGDGSTDGSMDAGAQGSMDGSMDGGAMSSGFFGGQGCEAGQTMTFAELRQQAEFSMSADQAPDASEVSGTVTTNGVVQHEGHETCHVTVEYDEEVGSQGMQLQRVEMYAGSDSYVDMQYFDASGTQRLRVTMEDNESSMTVYDEQGNEIQMPSGGQMPSGSGDFSGGDFGGY